MLEDHHLMQLTDDMTLSYFKEDERIYHQIEGSQEQSNKRFFIVIRGKVKLIRKNTEGIPNWKWALSVYKTLQGWKEQEFDKKIEKAMHVQLIKVRLSTNVGNLVKVMNKKNETKSKIYKTCEQNELAAQVFQIHSMLMDSTRDLYLNSQKKIQKSKE